MAETTWPDNRKDMHGLQWTGATVVAGHPTAGQTTTRRATATAEARQQTVGQCPKEPNSNGTGRSGQSNRTTIKLIVGQPAGLDRKTTDGEDDAGMETRTERRKTEPVKWQNDDRTDMDGGRIETNGHRTMEEQEDSDNRK